MASKRATILAYIRDTVLPLITTGGGYNFTVPSGSIRRGIYQIDDRPLSGFPVICIARTMEDRSNLTQIQFQGRLEVVILGYVKTATGLGGTMDEVEKLIQDITKALEQDRLQGGNVKWTEVKRIVTSDGDTDDLGVCAVTVEFQYVSEGVTP
jgi:hypothetical protein